MDGTNGLVGWDTVDLGGGWVPEHRHDFCFGICCVNWEGHFFLWLIGRGLGRFGG